MAKATPAAQAGRTYAQAFWSNCDVAAADWLRKATVADKTSAEAEFIRAFCEARREKRRSVR